jgi:hypothetical protein
MLNDSGRFVKVRHLRNRPEVRVAANPQEYTISHQNSVCGPPKVDLSTWQ